MADTVSGEEQVRKNVERGYAPSPVPVVGEVSPLVSPRSGTRTSPEVERAQAEAQREVERAIRERASRRTAGQDLYAEAARLAEEARAGEERRAAHERAEEKERLRALVLEVLAELGLVSGKQLAPPRLARAGEGG